ncbi:hypothetical protein WG66_003907 [Moniliophthora roreri]|nr:hypothetical protein WG66_003907 [Moniliophthora roreri]
MRVRFEKLTGILVLAHGGVTNISRGFRKLITPVYVSDPDVRRNVRLRAGAAHDMNQYTIYPYRLITSIVMLIDYNASELT